ncbi:class I SAM-dependent methyltransferase [Phreatobacter aquaticus]|uniref:class I SAM-dependent methyltransferase n=1 Tax=Phreatobacter aquaticus TaxID=2570229 RepID=UPI00143DA3B8|nr:methyltransferase domain-containing protein [Phreatobacter aquaticus]
MLHLGCTNWPYREQSSGDERFVHSVLLKEASEVWGVDADEEGLAALREQGVGHLYRGDLENLAELPIDRTFDVIVAGEVIEHLSNPGQFLSGIKRFMRNDTRLVITTVNAYCAFRMAIYGLRGRGGHSEPVHPDHVAYYSYKTLVHIAGRAGLELDQFLFYDLGHEHRPFARRSITIINDLVVRFMPQLADGVIGVFRLGPGEAGQ